MALDLNLSYDPRGFPDKDEELRILKQACLDAFGPCGEEVPIELLRGLKYQRAAVIGRVHATRMAASAARVREDTRRFTALTQHVSELDRKRLASGKHIADLHRKVAKLKSSRRAAEERCDELQQAIRRYLDSLENPRQNMQEATLDQLAALCPKDTQ